MINPLKFVSKIFKSRNQRELDRFKKIAENINSLENDVKKLEDAEFPKKTASLKDRLKKGENIAATSKSGKGSFKIEDINDFNKYPTSQWNFAYIVKEGKLTEESAMKAIINAKKGAKASGGGYSSWTKISNNSWKNKKTGRLAHNAGLYDRIGQFSDFVIEGKLNEVRVKKGDAIKINIIWILEIRGN